MRDKTKLIDAPERRGIAVTDFELRKDGDTLSLDGYASVFDAPYDVFGGPDAGGWSEIIDRRAFDVTLREKPDLHLLINHEGLPLARTKSGTLQLSTDRKGLRVKAPDLDRRDPDVQRLEVKMDRRDLDEMSFAFRTKRQEWSGENDETRKLLEVSLHKGDVSVVNFGANPATSAGLRSLQDIVDYLGDEDRVMAEVRKSGTDPLLQIIKAATERRRAAVPKRTLSVAEALKAIGD
jgi:HK97 family phage prohead protease